MSLFGFVNSEGLPQHGASLRLTIWEAELGFYLRARVFLRLLPGLTDSRGLQRHLFLYILRSRARSVRAEDPGAPLVLAPLGHLMLRKVPGYT